MTTLTDLSLYPASAYQSTAIGSVLAAIVSYSTPPALSISGTPEALPLLGSNEPFMPLVTGGAGPKVMSVVAGALPAGRSVSGLLVVGGYTTVGAYNYTLRVVDQNGVYADLACSEEVIEAVVVPDYLDDMSVAGNVTGRTNWTVELDGTDPSISKFTVASDKLSGQQIGANPAFALFGAAPATNHFKIRWDAASPCDLIFGYVDPLNYCFVNFNGATLEITKIVNGSDTRLGRSSFISPLSGASVVELYVLGDIVRLRFNGVWSDSINTIVTNQWPYEYIQASAAPNLFTGKIGVLNAGSNKALLSRIEITNLHMKPMDVPGMWSRDGKESTGTTRTLSVTAQNSVTPARAVARLVNARTFAVVQGWRYLTDQAISGATISGELFLPTGGPYLIEHGFIDTDGKLHAMHSKSVRVGIFIVAWGQSNASGRGDASWTGAPVPTQSEPQGDYPDNALGNQIGGNDDQGWGSFIHSPGYHGGHTDPWWYGSLDRRREGGSPYANVSLWAAKFLYEMLGSDVPVGVMGFGPAGASLASFLDSGDWHPAFVEVMRLFDSTPEAIIFDQGEGDWTLSNAATYGDRVINDLVPTLRGVFGQPDLPILLEMKGQYPIAYPSFVGNADQKDQIDAVIQLWRRSVQTMIDASAADNVWLSDVQLGITYGEESGDPDMYIYGVGAHPSGTGYIEEWRRTMISLGKHVFGVRDYDGTGLKITGGTRSGAVISLSLDMSADGVTGLGTYSWPWISDDDRTLPADATGQDVQGYQVFLATDTNETSPLTISTTRTVANKIVITLAADPGAACKVRSYYGYRQLDRVLACGTYAEDDPIPVYPILNSINVG